MHIKKCKTCGFALWLTRIMRWQENGTISWWLNPEGRLVLVKSDLFNNVFSHLEEEMGIPIGHIVFEAQRNAVAAGFDPLFSRFPASLGRIGPNRKLVIKLFCRLSIWIGTAYVEPLFYRPGKEGEALLRNPYNRDLMAALILGAFEGLERRPFEHAWVETPEGEAIHVTATAEKPEVSERLTPVPEKVKPGYYPLERCPSCGAPRDLSSLVWHEEDGMVMDAAQGERVNFLDAFTPGIVFRELEKELGSEVNPLIVEASRDFFLNRVMAAEVPGASSHASSGVDLVETFKDSLTFLPSYGQGAVTAVSRKDGGLEVSMINPYDRYLLAGYLSALYEKHAGTAAKVEWEEHGAESAASITYRIADSG